MRTHHRRISALTLTAGLAVSGFLVATPPAQATTQYAFITTNSSAGSGAKVLPSPFNCDLVSNPPVLPVDPGLPGNADDPPAFTEGGAPVTRTFNYGGTVTNSLNPADAVSVAASASTTVQFSGSGGNFTGFDVTSSGTATVTPALGAASGCYGSQRADADSSAVVTITQPSWLLVRGKAVGTKETAANPGYFYGSVYVQRVEPYVDANNVNYQYRNEYSGLEIESTTSETSAKILLTPGQYQVSHYFEIQASTIYQSVPPAGPTFAASSSRTANVSFSGQLVPVGAKDGPVFSAAKGKKYVKLLDRDCATDAVTAKLSKKKLKKASKVVFAVNGKKVKTVKLNKKFPKQGLVAVGPVADDVDATVTAVVFLRDKTKARPAVEQSYLSCS